MPTVRELLNEVEAVHTAVENAEKAWTIHETKTQQEANKLARDGIPRTRLREHTTEVRTIEERIEEANAKAKLALIHTPLKDHEQRLKKALRDLQILADGPSGRVLVIEQTPGVQWLRETARTMSWAEVTGLYKRAHIEDETARCVALWQELSGRTNGDKGELRALGEEFPPPEPWGLGEAEQAVQRAKVVALEVQRIHQRANGDGEGVLATNVALARLKDAGPRDQRPAPPVTIPPQPAPVPDDQLNAEPAQQEPAAESPPPQAA